jgi:hypothetical protein
MELIQTKEQWVLHRLERFYGVPENLNRVKNILSGESTISLRLLDWLVTNYAKKKDVAYKKDDRFVNVYLAYKSHLKAYSKKMFDPFCRWKKTIFNGMDTTVGQLNFFEWAIQDGVLDYLEANYDDVHADMENATADTSAEKPAGRRKRHELSRAATKSLRLHDVPCKVSFS